MTPNPDGRQISFFVCSANMPTTFKTRVGLVSPTLLDIWPSARAVMYLCTFSSLLTSVEPSVTEAEQTTHQIQPSAAVLP